MTKGSETDDGGEEVLEGLALDRHQVLAPLDGVAPSEKCMWATATHWGSKA